jgi:hypothetical protein
MTPASVTAVVFGIGLTILGFWLDRTGSAGMWLLVASLVLIVAFYYADRATGGMQFFLGALGVIPLVLVVAFSWSELYHGGQRVFAQDGVVVLDPPSTPTASATVSGIRPAHPGFNVIIEFPAERARVPLRGVVVDGKISGAQDQRTLWLMMKSPDDGGRHYLTDKITVVGQYWSLSTGQLGADDPNEIGKLFVIEVISTTGAGTRSFESLLKKAASGDAFFEKLPGGAEILAERVIKRV